jgi:hypothetical protein
MATTKSYMDSEALIKSVKSRALLPTSQSTFTNDDFLAFANEEMAIGLVPDVLIMHEDYLMYTELLLLETNVTRYKIPYRAIGNKLREVQYQDNSGNAYPMTRIGVADIPYYNLATNNNAYAFYVENNEICIVPQNLTPPTNAYLRMTYYMRPNQLVTSDQVAVVSSVDRNTGVIQLVNLPEAFNVSQKLDIIKVQSPNKTLDYDITPLAINSTSKTITLNLNDVPDALEAGDNIALAEQCCIPQVPSDLHVMLAHRTAMRCLDALGDTEGLQNAAAKLGEMKASSTVLIDNRVEDAPRKILNRWGTIRSGYFNRGRFGR